MAKLEQVVPDTVKMAPAALGDVREWVRKFSTYDLYSKGHAKPDVKKLKPYYDDLFAQFLPEELAW